MSDRFTAIVIETIDKKPVVSFKELSLSDLPDHDVLVEVAASTVIV